MGGTKEQAGVGRGNDSNCSRWVAGQIATWLAAATLTAIARLIIVHRAILARFRTTRLVCRETYCANHGGKNRKQNFQIILHQRLSLATTANSSENRELRCIVCESHRLPLQM